MKTVAIEQFGDADVFVEKDLPLPKPTRNEVRIKIKAVGFNPVDYKIRKGVFGEAEFPLVLGSECSGVIDAVGEEFHEFSIGDEVWAFALGPSSNGTYAEYICIPIHFVAKKPNNLSFAEAAAIPLTYLTAFQALIGTCALQQNRPLFIAGGSGGVGSAAIALAHCYKGGPVFTTAGSQTSRDYLVKKFNIPSDHILDYKNLSLDQMAEKLIEMNKKENFYLTFDCVGGLMKQLCFAVCGFSGHVATILPEEADFPVSIWGREESVLFHYSQSLHLIFLGASALYGNEKDWRVYHSQLGHLTHLFEKEGLMKPSIECVGSFSVETVKTAHKRLESGHTLGKLVMDKFDST